MRPFTTTVHRPNSEYRGLANRREERVGRGRDRWPNRADGDPQYPAVAQVEGVTFDFRVGALPGERPQGRGRERRSSISPPSHTARPGSGQTDRLREEYLTVERESW